MHLAFLALLNADPAKVTVAHIPTARNMEPAGARKQDAQRIAANFERVGIGHIETVDIDALSRSQWLARLTNAQVLYVGGGNTYYLLNSVRRSGLDKALPMLLVDRVYIGDSAGGIILTPCIDIAEVDDGDKNEVGITDTSGLGLVDFEVSPHTPEDVSLKANRDYARTTANPLYAFDNDSGLLVTEQGVQQVGAGQHWVYNTAVTL